MALGAGQSVVVVQDLQAFSAYYGGDVLVAGQYAGQLDNGGERLRLEDAIGRTIVDFSYDDKWYRTTDGDGCSLTLVNSALADPGSLGERSAWRASLVLGGSPGTDGGDAQTERVP
jgi:hypothetical protein